MLRRGSLGFAQIYSKCCPDLSQASLAIRLDFGESYAELSYGVRAARRERTET